MKDEKLTDVAALWQKAKTSHQGQPKANIHELMASAQARKKKALSAHYGNAVVLSITVLLLMFYFYYLYHFQDVLSKIGYHLMIGGLIIRIAIEFFSVWRSKQVHISDTTARSLQQAVAFHHFRKRIHGPVTLIIFVVYFVGFYLLTPEFHKHISLAWLIFMDISALIIAIVLAYIIRKGIRQELVELEKLVELQRSLVSRE